jgi:hypothetical protein
MSKNNGILKEGCKVTVCMADTSGNCVWSYKATYKDGWFDHGNPSGNARHDTPAMMYGCYAWYIVENDQGETR